ncbi:hypothetical protein [Phreatobacter oligotrophus]|uniref:Alg9-like mannosyltransferase family protein n=1 Tax=Phreatobacter oligotrophus TaxID=1122261 RepID=A0A2T4Z0Z8_9HYPH|nr:hypothetical protein [Phreatobacter oligotrophus]PTM53393.1 Alg9-like mannosyltransferase family protein [Phreatobacter oligotrophus]
MTAGSTPRPLLVSAAAGVFLVAFLVRLLAAILAPGIHHEDEIFQSLEQAHRLVFGYGFVPWEFEHGIRSWLLPGALAAAMRVGLLFGDGPQAYLPVVQALLSAIGAGAVACIFLWAQRLFGLWPALVAAVIPAFAPELVYFGPRALTEVVAGHLLVIGLYLALPGEAATGRGRLVLAGFLLGLVVAIRLQMAPAVGVVGLYALWRWPLRQALWLAAGGLAAVVLSGLTDWWTWGAPFLSAWQNVRYNIGHGVAAHFGVEPWFQYPALLVVVFGSALALLLPLAVAGARFKPLLAVLMLAIFAAHQPIGHKEIRFLYPLMVLLEALAAIGLAWAVARLQEHLPRLDLPWRPFRAWLPAAAALGCLTLFVVGRLATFVIIPDQGLAWLKQRSIIEAARHIARLPGVCGIGSYGIAWVQSGGYVNMHQPVPFHETTTIAAFREAEPAFNTILFPRSQREALGITGGRCFGQRCVAQRPGPCAERPIAPLSEAPPLPGLEPLKRLWPPAGFPPRP